MAIYIAENFLKWIPKGTHTYDKFIKPNEIKNCMQLNNFKLKDITGLVFDPINYGWKMSYNTSVNYFCTYEKVS